MCSTRCTGCRHCEPATHECDRCGVTLSGLESRDALARGFDVPVCAECIGLEAHDDRAELALTPVLVSAKPANDVRPLVWLACCDPGCDACYSRRYCPRALPGAVFA